MNAVDSNLAGFKYYFKLKAYFNSYLQECLVDCLDNSKTFNFSIDYV